LALKHAHEPKYFEQNLSKILNFEWRKYSTEILDSFITTLFFYLEKVTHMKSSQIIEKSEFNPAEWTEMANITIDVAILL
jgi:hypothetical protein